jgi:hypothetical protein
VRCEIAVANVCGKFVIAIADHGLDLRNIEIDNCVFFNRGTRDGCTPLLPTLMRGLRCSDDQKARLCTAILGVVAGIRFG